ncbi:unnamed protein product, partial [Meganyctiphanes norvegica]
AIETLQHEGHPRTSKRSAQAQNRRPSQVRFTANGRRPQDRNTQQLSNRQQQQVIFTANGRPLDPSTLPELPDLPNLNPRLGRRPSNSATRFSRPFRGELPPSVPEVVPFMPQFRRQRRPATTRREPFPIPPLVIDGPARITG